MTVFRSATLRIFFFAIHAGAKELKNGTVSIPSLLGARHFRDVVKKQAGKFACVFGQGT